MNSQQIEEALASMASGEMMTVAHSGAQYVSTWRLVHPETSRFVYGRALAASPTAAIGGAYDLASSAQQQ